MTTEEIKTYLQQEIESLRRQAQQAHKDFIAYHASANELEKRAAEKHLEQEEAYKTQIFALEKLLYAIEKE